MAITLIHLVKFLGYQVAVHGVNGDEQKKHTKVIKRSREPHWEDQEFEFRLRGEHLVYVGSSLDGCQSVVGYCKLLMDHSIRFSLLPWNEL